MVFITDRFPLSTMDKKRITAVALVLTMLLSGCLNVDPDVDVPDVVLPDDWSTITARTVASPQLFAYDDCDELETALKRSIEEQYRVELLQAVAEQYSYNDFMRSEDAGMAVEDSAAADGAAPHKRERPNQPAWRARTSPARTTRRPTSTRPILSKPTATISITFEEAPPHLWRS